MGKQSEKKIFANKTKIIITVLLVITFVMINSDNLGVIFQEYRSGTGS
ncbi:MAG: hypothetical protein ACLTER_01795 [Ruminococcus sp.]